MTTKLVRDLEEGDMIDLVPALEKYATLMTPDEIAHDVSSMEYAIVESVDDFAAFVVLYTDQHNLNLPAYFEFDVVGEDDGFSDEEVADANGILDILSRKDEVAPSMDGGR